MAISGTREARSQEIRLEEITQREEENFIKSLFPAGEDSLGGLGSGGGDFPSQGQQGQGDFLPVAGGTMLGAIAFYPKLIEIADGHIDIGKEIGQFTSRVILNAEGAPTTDNIVAILNAEHAGQFLVIQGTTGETITIKDVSSAETAWATSTVYSAGDEVSNGGSIYVCHTGHTSSASDEPGVGANWEDFWYKGNLMTVDGNNFSLVGEDNLIFMFDSVSNTWRQITTGAQGITSGANKELSNLNVTSINEHLIPQAGKNLGDAGNLWSSLYANHLRLGTAGTLLGSENMIIADATNGIEINVPSGDIVRFYENAVAGPWISSAVLDMSSFNTNIKSGGLELYDFTTDPITNGEFRRNGVDVKVYSGGAVRNLSDIIVGGGADRQLTNLIADTAINQDLIPDPAESGLLNLGGGGANENWNVVYADRFNAIAEGYTTSTPGYKRGLNDEIYIDIPLTSGSFDVRENGTGVLGTTTAGTDPWLRFHVLANGGILQLFGTGVAGEDTLIKLGTGTDASEIKYDNDGDFTLNNLAGGVTRGVNVLNNGLSSFNMRSDRNYSNQILNMQAKLMEQVGDLHPDTGGVRSIGNSAGPQNQGFNMYLYEILGWAGNPTDTFIKMTNGSVTEAIEIRTNIAGDDIAIRTNGASSDINVEYTQFLNLGTSTFPSIVQYASNSVTWNSFDRTSNVNLFMQTNYIDIASQTIASVGTPAVGNRRIFVDSVTGELSIKKNDLSVVSLEGGGGGSPLTTKGDLYTYTTVDARLPVGNDRQVLLAESSQSTGLVWADLNEAHILNASNYWTQHSNHSVWICPSLFYDVSAGGFTNQAVTLQRYCYPLFISAPTTLKNLSPYVGTGSNSQMKTAIYENSTNGENYPGTKVAETSQNFLSGSGFLTSVASYNLSLDPGLYWIVVQFESTTNSSVYRLPAGNLHNVGYEGDPNSTGPIVGWQEVNTGSTSFPTNFTSITDADVSPITGSTGLVPVIWARF